MINRVVLVGRLTKEPELITTPSRKCVCSFTIAVNRRTHQEGKPDTDFINCVAWNQEAESLEKYTKKGSLIGIEGRIQTRSYDDKNGKKVYITEVLVRNKTFLEKSEKNTSDFDKGVINTKGSNKSRLESNSESDMYAQSLTEEAEKYTLELSDDDLPF